ncbi:hypothetical protein [Sphingomonas aerophila]|uniref:Lipoprotein n=1 Tax=Sphingomonas aerophila TaxID=1344948 RepID=A0A7W9EXE0_9SPHN|nr:hypothetical protein [Sphingomonas aerophila]MBB5716438.1 hypothetical protein [Sphingomonas aerophila]
MKLYLILAAFLATTACDPPEARRQAELMNTIERKITLPPGAGAVERFARAYKFASPDRVEALYFIPEEEPDRMFCEGTKRYGHKNGQIALACPPPDGMKAGERRWFADDVILPFVSDGACAYIDVEYQVGSKTVPKASCHGEG